MKLRDSFQVAALPLCVVVASLSAVPAQELAPAELLNTLEGRRGEIRTLYIATKTTIRESGETRESTAQHWEQREGKERKTRRTTRAGKAPSGNKELPVVETLAVSDGQYEWLEMPTEGGRIAIRRRASHVGEFAELRELLRTAKARTKDSEPIVGHLCAVLEFAGVGKGTRFKTAYWISEEYGLVLKHQAIHAGGDRTETVTTELKINEPIADETFVYTPSKDVQVLDTVDTGGSTGRKSEGE